MKTRLHEPQSHQHRMRKTWLLLIFIKGAARTVLRPTYLASSDLVRGAQMSRRLYELTTSRCFVYKQRDSKVSGRRRKRLPCPHPGRADCLHNQFRFTVSDLSWTNLIQPPPPLVVLALARLSNMCARLPPKPPPALVSRPVSIQLKAKDPVLRCTGR